MIDFSKNTVFKLSPCKPQDIAPTVQPIIIHDEEVMACADIRQLGHLIASHVL